MAGGEAKNGQVLEEMVEAALRHGGYSVQTQVDVGSRPGGRRHKVDLVAAKGEHRVLVSVKWQQSRGTVEQKVPFEVICLKEALGHGPGYALAYLVLGGEGWQLRTFYTSGGLDRYLRDPDRVRIVTFERFIAAANQGGL